MPIRAKGIPTGLQIEARESETNPYYHSTQDTVAHMDLDYWTEQMEATAAIVAHLAIPVTSTIADTDGDGSADVSVWRPGTGTWYILPSASPGTYIGSQ